MRFLPNYCQASLVFTAVFLHDESMKQNKPSMILGFGIIALGLLLLLELLNVVHDSDIYDILWPATVSLVGMVMVSTKTMRAYGYVIFWIGFLLVLRQINVFSSDAGKTILVLVMTLTGLGLVAVLGDKLTPPKPPVKP